MFEILETNDGSHTILSKQFGLTYHSKFGAIQETQHVFINAGFRYKAVVLPEINIFETGFGTGLNAFMTLLEAQKRNIKVNYMGYELYPLDMDNILKLNYIRQLGLGAEGKYFTKMHRCEWGKKVAITPTFNFTKKQADFTKIRMKDKFDLVYYDSFAPTAQPYLWEESMLKKLHFAMKEGACLVTYCAKGEFKRTLKKLGFEVESLLGPAGKREMTRATKV